MESTIRRKKLRLITCVCVLSILLLISFLLSITIGSLDLTLRQVFEAMIGINKDPTVNSIVLGYRIPRVLFSTCTGFTLGVAGTVIQTLTRNPLADPYITGMSSGAALGAAIAFLIPALPLLAAPLLAFIGGASMLFLTIFFAKKAGGGSVGFVLSGIAVGTIANAVLMMIISMSGEMAHGILYWIFGSFSTSTWGELQTALLVSLPAIVYIFLTVKDLNILLLGEEHARQLGVEARRLWFTLLVSSSLAVAAWVSFCGVIGFIGLVAPHIVRLSVGSDNRFVLPLAGLTGSLLLLVSDDIVRAPLIPIGEMPVGSITSIIGVPFFIYLLTKRGRSLGM